MRLTFLLPWRRAKKKCDENQRASILNIAAAPSCLPTRQLPLSVTHRAKTNQSFKYRSTITLKRSPTIAPTKFSKVTKDHRGRPKQRTEKNPRMGERQAGTHQHTIRREPKMQVQTSSHPAPTCKPLSTLSSQTQQHQKKKTPVFESLDLPEA